MFIAVCLGVLAAAVAAAYVITEVGYGTSLARRESRRMRSGLGWLDIRHRGERFW